jgi:CRP-like cAMP-binding protein
VYWEAPSGERRLLTQLPPGSIFGEMGLLTGAPRSATVVAHSDVECYRLDKAGLEGILHERQAIAESMSHILSTRQQQNDALRAEFRKAQSDAERAAHPAALLQRIRDYFGLQ